MVLLAIWDVSADATVVAIGAGAAALTAAVTAQYRLRAQLKHDSRMRERDATRDALDGVVSEISSTAGAMNAAATAFDELFNVRSASRQTGSDHGLDDAGERARLAVQSLRELRVPLMTASFRLHLRFPDTHPIIGTLAEWRATFDQLADAYDDALLCDDIQVTARFDAARATALRLGEQLNAFLEVARAWASEPRSRRRRQQPGA